MILLLYYLYESYCNKKHFLICTLKLYSEHRSSHEHFVTLQLLQAVKKIINDSFFINSHNIPIFHCELYKTSFHNFYYVF